MKYSKLENKAMKELEKGNKKKYYKYVLEICENDIEILDSVNERLAEFFNLRLNKSKQKEMLNTIQELFEREHANIDNKSNDLMSWLGLLECEVNTTTNYIVVKVGV